MSALSALEAQEVISVLHELMGVSKETARLAVAEHLRFEPRSATFVIAFRDEDETPSLCLAPTEQGIGLTLYPRDGSQLSHQQRQRRQQAQDLIYSIHRGSDLHQPLLAIGPRQRPSALAERMVDSYALSY